MKSLGRRLFLQLTASLIAWLSQSMHKSIAGLSVKLGRKSERPDRRILINGEFSGISFSDGARMTELACLEIQDGQYTGQHLHYHLAPFADGSHSQGVPFHEIAADVHAFVKNSPLIAFNADYEIGFLNFEFARAGTRQCAGEFSGIVALARHLWPSHPASLSHLCDRLSIPLPNKDAKNALIDAITMHYVYRDLQEIEERIKTKIGI